MQFLLSKSGMAERSQVVVQLLQGTHAYQHRGNAVVAHQPGHGHLTQRLSATLRQIMERLRKTYCGKIGVEFMHISDPDQKAWIQERIEHIENHTEFTVTGRKMILERVGEAEGLERYLHVKFVGTKRFGLDGAALGDQHDKATWPDLRARFAETFRTRTRDEWCEVMEGTDVCFAPVLTMKEIANDPSLRESGTIVEVDHKQRGKYLTVGSPIKLSDSPVTVTRPPLLGEHTDDLLTRLCGVPPQELQRLQDGGCEQLTCLRPCRLERFAGARYRYLLVRFRKNGEIAEVIPTNEMEVP